jgi:hypothetical protein
MASRAASTLDACRRGCVLLALLLLATTAAFAGHDSNLTEERKDQIIREFLAEQPWVHRALPRGMKGVSIEQGRISPTEAELASAVAQHGVVAKPGDRVRITGLKFIHQGVVFELNGGPQRRKSWKDRISVGTGPTMINPTTGSAPADDIYNAASGSTVTVLWKGESGELSTARLKELLEPVLDFKSETDAEAYQKSLPPKLAEAIKSHHALVGMNKEMVMYALGRPPRRERQVRDGQEYEEWIYGTPPREMQFIRFAGDRAVSIEEMKVSGEKRLRTQDEVGELMPGLARRKPAPSAEDEQPGQAPSLLRPGETAQKSAPGARDPSPQPPVDRPGPDSTNSGPPLPGDNNRVPLPN